MQVPLFGSVEKHRKDQPQKSKYIFHICHKEKVKHRLCRWFFHEIYGVKYNWILHNFFEDSIIAACTDRLSLPGINNQMSAEILSN